MRIQGVGFADLDFDSAVSSALSFLARSSAADIFFLNLDCLRKSQHDPEYRAVLNQADLVLPDGIGLQLATAWLLGRACRNCNGSDFSPRLLAECASRGYRIYFFGGHAGVAALAAGRFRERFPGLVVAGCDSGYFDCEDEVIRRINAARPDVLFVALGAPLQEKWIARNRAKLHPRLCLGVGALLDYWAGRIPRAPRILQRLKLEWAWRIAQEPGRLVRRYWDDLKYLASLIGRRGDPLGEKWP